jgi:hypothetical protein
MNFLPDRKIWSGGIAAVVAWAIVLIISHSLHVTVDADTQSALVLLVGGAISYLVPPSKQDIVKRLNDDLVKMAQDDPNVPVTKPAPDKS